VSDVPALYDRIRDLEDRIRSGQIFVVVMGTYRVNVTSCCHSEAASDAQTKQNVLGERRPARNIWSGDVTGSIWAGTHSKSYRGRKFLISAATTMELRSPNKKAYKRNILVYLTVDEYD